MQTVRKRLTYANVVSSLALFIAVAGGSAFAATQLAKNSVGSKQLKANAVTTAKIKKNAITTAKIKNNAISAAKIQQNAISGSKIDVNTLGTVPSAQTAESVAGRIPVSVFTPEGTVTLATVGHFTLTAECQIDDAGQDWGRFYLTTAVDGASMDDNNGDAHFVFDKSESPADLWSFASTTGAVDLQVAPEPGLTAIAPDGSGVIFGNETIGLNITGKPGQCYFAGMIQRIG